MLYSNKAIDCYRRLRNESRVHVWLNYERNVKLPFPPVPAPHIGYPAEAKQVWHYHDQKSTGRSGNLLSACPPIVFDNIWRQCPYPLWYVQAKKGSEGVTVLIIMLVVSPYSTRLNH